jgi:hypothetical protein
MCFVLATYYPLQLGWDMCLQFGTDTVCNEYFIVSGCDNKALNEAISSLAACNLLVADVCHSTCMTGVINKLKSIGCFKNDVRDLLLMYLDQKGQKQAVNLVNLVWQCAGQPYVEPPSGCITTAKPTVKTTAKPTTTTKKPKKKNPKKPKRKPAKKSAKKPWKTDETSEEENLWETLIW